MHGNDNIDSSDLLQSLSFQSDTFLMHFKCVYYIEKTAIRRIHFAEIYVLSPHRPVPSTWRYFFRWLVLRREIFTGIYRFIIVSNVILGINRSLSLTRKPSNNLAAYAFLALDCCM